MLYAASQYGNVEIHHSLTTGQWPAYHRKAHTLMKSVMLWIKELPCDSMVPEGHCVVSTKAVRYRLDKFDDVSTGQ